MVVWPQLPISETWLRNNETIWTIASQNAAALSTLEKFSVLRILQSSWHACKTPHGHTKKCFQWCTGVWKYLLSAGLSTVVVCAVLVPTWTKVARVIAKRFEQPSSYCPHGAQVAFKKSSILHRVWELWDRYLESTTTKPNSMPVIHTLNHLCAQPICIPPVHSGAVWFSSVNVVCNNSITQMDPLTEGPSATLIYIQAMLDLSLPEFQHYFPMPPDPTSFPLPSYDTQSFPSASLVP